MRRATVGLIAVLLTVGIACTPTKLKPLPPAPSIPATTTTTLVDFSAIGLKSVVGRTTTTILMGPGQATLAGTVSGPNGPIEGAIVRAERLVGDGAGSADLLTQPDGTWSMPAVLGGRYRIRAWRAPDLALTTPEVFFLQASEAKMVDVRLTPYQGFAIAAAVAPNPPILDEPAGIVVQVIDQVVDDQGVVRGKPVPGVKVELTGSADWRLLTPNPVVSDAGGQARWQGTCRRVGQAALSAVLNDTGSYPLNLAPCTAAPPPEFDPNASSTTTAAPTASTTTTTTVTTTTTTTTRPTTSTTH